MSAQFWLGMALVPALLLLAWVVLAAWIWGRWWFIHDDGRFHGGKGRQHVADFYDAESGKWWPRSQHTHWWPPDTPWWLVRAAEPVRIWLCHHSADHRPATDHRGEQ